MRDKLKITKRSIKGYDFIDISGDIMLEGSKELVKFVKKSIAGKDRDIYLNLNDVHHVNSSALSPIVQMVRDTSTKKANIYLMNVNDKIMDLIKIAGLNNFFKFVSDETALIEKIDKENSN